MKVNRAAAVAALLVSAVVLLSATAGYNFVGVTAEQGTTAAALAPSTSAIIDTPATPVPTITWRGIRLESPIPVSSVQTGDVLVSRDPLQIVVNSNTGRIYVEDWVRSNVTVIDAKSHSVVTTISLPGDSGEIAIDYSTNMLYVPVGDCIDINLPNITNSCYAKPPPPAGRGGILEIDGSTNEIVRKFPYPLSLRTGDLAVNSATHVLYGVSSSHLFGIDIKTGSLVANIALSFDVVSGVAVDSSTNMIYVVGCTGELACGSVMSIVNGTTQSVQKTVDLRSGTFSRVILNPATHTVYVTRDSHLVALNGRNGDVLYNAWTGTCFTFDHLEFIQSTNQVLATTGGLKYVLVFDGSTGNLVNMYDTSPSEPQYVAYNPATQELYVTLSGHLLSFRSVASIGHVNSTLIGPGVHCPVP